MNGIPAWAVKGAKVVCVKDFRTARTVDDLGYRGLPELRSVYTIEDADWEEKYGIASLSFAEFPRAQWFDARGFRPLVTRSQEQDVARFRKHLRTKRTRTDAAVKIPHHGEVS